MKSVRFLIVGFLLAISAQAFGQFAIFQTSSSVVAPSCSSGLVDAVAASPGSYTWGISFRKIRAAFAGSGAMQLQRTSDNATQNVGFIGCDFDTTTAGSFCSSATLAVTTTSARIALPSGSSIFVYNTDLNGAAIYYVLGNSSVVATTSGTVVQVQSGTWVTVGANTNIAVIAATGSGTNTIWLTNCGVRTAYDQIGTNNATQTTQSKQLAYFPTISNGKPGMVGTSTGTNGGTCGMTVADNAAFKTTVVHMFATATLNLGTDSNTQFRQLIGYPNATSSDASALRWGLSVGPYLDTISVIVNTSTGGFGAADSSEGFGSAIRTVPIVYDFATSDAVLRYNNTAFYTGTPAATVTYPNAVGIYIGGDAAGDGCYNVIINEFLLASAKQTTPANVVNNTITYWNSAIPTTSVTTADGFTWTKNFIGGFARNPPNSGYITINSKQYASEGSWSPWGIWQATNVKTSGTTALGDMTRFEIRGTDEDWQGASGQRNELDGSPNAMALDTIYWIAYAFQLETGTGLVLHPPADWNIPGQAHGSGGSVASPFYFNVYGNQLTILKDDVVVYTSASNFIATGTWIQVVVRVRKSTSGTTDIFEVNMAQVGTTPLPQLYTCSGACFGTSTGQIYWKFGIYHGNYEPLNTIPIPQAWRYCNVQVSTSSLAAQITTPLDSCTQHN